MLKACFIICLCALQIVSVRSQSPAGDHGGSFLLHKFAQNIGREKYTVTLTDSALVYTIDFKFVDRGSPVPLNAVMRVRPDLRPISLAVKGQNSRFSSINDTVSILGQQAHIHERDTSFDKPIENVDFPVAGYAPGTVQMLMLQYWKKNGRPAEMSILPSGRVGIRLDGTDTLRFNQQEIVLERYVIAGLIWGNELAWTDKQGQMYCLITNDAEADKLEMMLEPYEALLPVLIGKAASYSMKIFASSLNKTLRPPDTIAIAGGTILDLVNGKELPDQTVLIEHGRIVWVGPSGEFRQPSSAPCFVLNAKGKIIMPGLWDMHAHFEQAEWGPAYLAAGVTSVRDCGNEFDYINAIQAAIDEGRGIGPHILKAGIIDGKGKMALGIIQADTREEAVAAVQRYKQNGFVQIKIYSSVKPAIVKAICQEAHRLGLTVTGHIPDGMNIIQGIDSGMDMVNHIEYVIAKMKINFKDQTIDLSDSSNQFLLNVLVRHHTVIDPTLAVFEMIFRSIKDPMTDIEPAFATLPPSLQELFNSMGMSAQRASSMKSYMSIAKQVVKILQDKGITLVAGTDQLLPGLSLYRELELYVEAGLSPLEALRTATVQPAKVMKLLENFGSVEAGKQADLILVDADPLENISNIRKISVVLKTGRIYSPIELHQLVGFSK